MIKHIGRCLILLVGISLTSHIMSLDIMSIQQKSLFYKPSMGKVGLSVTDGRFFVEHQDTMHKVNSYDIDPVLRKLNTNQLAKFVVANRIAISKYNNGDYKLNIQSSLKGGGIFGANAGFYIGKGVVYFVSYGAIGIISAFTGPAYNVTFATLTGLTAPTIEAASNVAALACGVTGAVATGLV